MDLYLQVKKKQSSKVKGWSLYLYFWFSSVNFSSQSRLIAECVMGLFCSNVYLLYPSFFPSKVSDIMLNFQFTELFQHLLFVRRNIHLENSALFSVLLPSKALVVEMHSRASCTLDEHCTTELCVSRTSQCFFIGCFGAFLF